MGLEVGVGFVGSRFCTPLSVGSGKEGCCLDKCYPSSDITCVGDGIVADCDGEDDDHASSQSHRANAIIGDDVPADSAGGTSEMIYHTKRIK